MYFKAACLMILAIVAATRCEEHDEIIRQDFEGPHEDGSYRWALQTGGGIFHEQRGRVAEDSPGAPSFLVEGQFQYTAPDGQVINVLYKADKNGFVATGDHLPTPPPIPIAIQKMLEKLATKEPPTEN